MKMANSDQLISTLEEICDGFSTDDQRAFEIAMNIPNPMMSTTGVEIKAEIKEEIKEEITDGFSTTEQSAFEIVQNLPIPLLSTAKVQIMSAVN